MWLSIRTSLSALVLLILLPLMASAYTIVLRDGRQLSIPDDFVVGASTITYPAGAGIQITLQLTTIDIAATERANKQAAGSLMARSIVKTATSIQRRGRTVTNDDLERYRQVRIASEAAYEKRRKELGLPSAEESRRAALAIGERAQEQLLSTRSQEQQAETYWRNRASELRAEVAATNERIAYVQERLNVLPVNYSFGAFATVSPFLSVDQLARGARIGPQIFTNQGARFGASIGFGNRVRGRVFANSFPRPGFARQQFDNRFPFGTLVALPFDSYDNSYERSVLLSQIDELLAQRAGLQARWRALEDEARRSGAYPGWLR